jgi:hypothetical protein
MWSEKRRKRPLLAIEGGATWDRAQMGNSPRARAPSTDSPSDFLSCQPIARRIPNTVPTGSPSSFAIARPLRPRARSRFTASRFTVCGRPSLTPRRFAEARPALIALTAAECLNSSIASRTLRNALLDNLDVSMRLGIIKTVLCANVSEHLHEPRHTAAKPVQTGGQHDLDFSAPDRSQKLFQTGDDVNVFPAPRHAIMPERTVRWHRRVPQWA